MPAPVVAAVKMAWNGQPGACVFRQDGRRIEITLDRERVLEANQRCEFVVSINT